MTEDKTAKLDNEEIERERKIVLDFLDKEGMQEDVVLPQPNEPDPVVPVKEVDAEPPVSSQISDEIRLAAQPQENAVIMGRTDRERPATVVRKEDIDQEKKQPNTFDQIVQVAGKKQKVLKRYFPKGLRTTDAWIFYSMIAILLICVILVFLSFRA